MRASIRTLIGGLALLASGAAAPAQPRLDPPGNPMPAVRADRWTDAEAAVNGVADPVPRKLVTYYRMLAPGAATAPEIADFMRQNPDWPAQALLERRRQEAIATEPDQAIVLAQCALTPPTRGNTMLRCAEAMANAGQTADATALARKAWVEAISDPGTEAAYQRRWNGIATQDEEWARFERLAWRDIAAATRQVPRLDPGHRAIAEARLSLKRGDPNADATWSRLPAAVRNDPGMVLDRARYLRRQDRVADALALWTSAGDAAQRAAPDHLTLFWGERHVLARQLLRESNPAGAYAIAAGHGQSAIETSLDAEFLAGFIALRMLKDPAKAIPHFQALDHASKAAITQGRAHYWLGRAAAAAGKDPKPAYERAARYITTFYGQMAAVALGDDPAKLAARIRSARDPAWVPDVAQGFPGHEVVRAAAWLVAWGEPARARIFLLRMDEIAPIPAERSLTATFALRIGLPDSAVFVARRVGRDGGMLPESGWPMPYTPPTDFDAAIALGIMRQESSFDIGAVSSSGARGLMQLMPFTARDVAKKIGIQTSLAALTTDTSHNMRLGTTYLHDMLARFDGSLPLAVASYNAGPHRVDQWLAENGDPRGGGIDMIDWIELIPFNETRNYVQRVLENVVIYRAKRNETTPTLLPQWGR
ncbi:MAG: transglycosylase SLT domain-containing protein [Acetobacteraceae bacterium]